VERQTPLGPLWVPGFRAFRVVGHSNHALRARHSSQLGAAKSGLRVADDVSRFFKEDIVRTNASFLRSRSHFRYLLAMGVILLLAAPVFAQGNSPWENAVNVLQQAFTSTIARGLSLVAIVVAGLTFAFAPLKRMSATP
jgi:hypothetical protein